MFATAQGNRQGKDEKTGPRKPEQSCRAQSAHQQRGQRGAHHRAQAIDQQDGTADHDESLGSARSLAWARLMAYSVMALPPQKKASRISIPGPARPSTTRATDSPPPTRADKNSTRRRS